jgi:hypothetical protein
MIGRELKMVELKKEIADLKKKKPGDAVPAEGNPR